MNNITLIAEKRNETGGRKARRLRREGYIPAVFYGKGTSPIPLKVKVSELRELLAKGGENAFFSMQVDGEAHSAIIKDIQNDLLTNDIIHIDMQKVSLNEKISSTVGIRIVGSEKLQKGSNVLVHQLDEADIRCFPQDLPQYIEADVSGLEPGQSFTVADLKVPEGVEVLNRPDEVIVTLTVAKETIEEDTPEEVREPEQIAGSED